MIHDLVREALRNAKENGDEPRLRALTLTGQAVDLVDCVDELQKPKFKDVFDALCDVLLENDVAYFLNTMQIEKRKHRLLDPIHAIQFAIHQYHDGLEFLKCWNEGDWAGCAQWENWKDFKP